MCRSCIYDLSSSHKYALRMYTWYRTACNTCQVCVRYIPYHTRVIRYHTPSDDFQSWVSRQRGGRTEYGKSDASIQPSRRNLSRATIFRCVRPPMFWRKPGLKIVPGVCVILSPSVIRYVRTCFLSRRTVASFLRTPNDTSTPGAAQSPP